MIPEVAEVVREKAARLPRSPGVYLFLDARNRVLYVGKAADLRSRVRQYLAGSDERRQVPVFLARSRDLDFQVTRTEAEALLLENTLIKRHRPHWNVRLRDDKAYPCLRLDTTHRFPRFTVVRRFRDDGALYFGPFAEAGHLRRAMRALRAVYPLRSCSDSFLESRRRPCVYHEIGRCNAPCVDLVTVEEYGVLVDEVVSMLRGDTAGLLRDLRRRMEEASEGTRYEEAAGYRDRIAAIEKTTARQTVAGADGKERDAVAFRREGGAWTAGIAFLRGGAIASFRFHRLTAVGADVTEPAEALSTFLAQFYERGKQVPAEVLVPFEPADAEVLEPFLKGRRGGAVRVRVPARGVGRTLLEHAERNLLAALEAEDPERGHQRAAEALARRLGMEEPPSRIECLDISNLGDREVVASRVVSEDGRLVSDETRTMRIRDVSGQDDFASIREAVRRRLSNEGVFGAPPDLLLVDGGQGQVGAAVEGAGEAGVADVPMAGIAKARRGRDGEAARERLFAPGATAPVILPPGAPETHLVERIRDEAHRVAITFHRNRRRKGALKSVLDDIQGVGPKRRTALLRAFGSSKGIAEAGVDAVEEVLRSRSLAERVIAAVTARP
ncbi:MAG: excinuclease ABC subunit UvrC [Planctomycetota bacterium]